MSETDDPGPANAQVDTKERYLLPTARALFVQAAAEHMSRIYSQTGAPDMEKYFAEYCRQCLQVPGCGKVLCWTSIKTAMIRPMWSNVSQIELDFFMAIARRLGPDDVVDAIECAKKLQAVVVQVKLSLDSDSEENEESTTTIKMLKRRVRCFATKPQNPLRERHSTVDSKASLLPADKGKEKRSGEDKGAVRKRPMDNNKQPGETETKKQARIGDGIGSGRGRKPQKSAHNGGGPMRSDASAEDRREVDGSSEDPPGGTASGTEARRSSGGGGKRAGGNADETGSHERLPPTAAVKRVRLSKEEHMAALPGFGLQLGTTASIEVKWIVELGKGKCESRWYPAQVDLSKQQGWGRRKRPKWPIVYIKCKGHNYTERSMVAFKSDTKLFDDLDDFPVSWRKQGCASKSTCTLRPSQPEADRAPQQPALPPPS